MISAIFQNSKTALGFAGVVVFGTLMMVGTEEDAGVLDKTVSTIKDERASFANQTAAMSMEWSNPETADTPRSGLEENDMMAEPPAFIEDVQTFNPAPGYSVENRTLMLSDLSQEPALPAGMPRDSGPSMRNARNASPDASDATAPAAEAKREAVVTSRMIRIEPE